MTTSRLFLLSMSNISNTICRENQRHTVYVQWLLRKACRFWDNVTKYGGAIGKAENIAPARGILDKWAYMRASTHGRSHTRTHACPHPRTSAHIHIEICYTYYFPLQQWFRKRASILSYTYAVCFVLSLIYPFGVLFGFVLHNSLPFMTIISDLENVYKWRANKMWPKSNIKTK
jgi:hypothetical protein